MLLGSIALLFQDGQLCILPLIAVFVWIAGGRELMAVRMRHGMSPFGSVRVASPFERAPYAKDPTRTEPPAGAEPGSTMAQRPADLEGRAPSGGFSEQTVRELERFHGRLRPPHQEEE
jgi:hypothetical protein